MFMQITTKATTRFIDRNYLKALFGLTISFLYVGYVNAIPAQVPLYLAQAATPIMMLNMSTDHQLYFKVYDDYGDITDTRSTIAGVNNPNYLKNTGDGVADTTYITGYDYYGYFDGKKCYVYSTANSRFEPSRAVDSTNYCNYNNGAAAVTNEWSGNFLNWATMTRIDIVRKILYGGLRQASNDTASLTVLERAYLPSDAHAFTKYYNGADLAKLTPAFTSGSVPTAIAGSKDSGITFCNVTGEDDGKYSQTSTKAPLIRVAKGNYSLWASSERWQCRWGTGSGSDSTLGKNGNDPTKTGIYAYDYAPVKGDTTKSLSVTGLGTAGEYVVRVQVCKDATLAEDNCRQYPSATYRNKPAGLLQIYGETNELNFGLITGSHGRNKDGGVLRKNVGNILDEVNADTDGTFKSVPADGGIINTLNLLRMFGYSWSIGDAGSYGNTTTGGDSCTYGLETFPNGNCSNWGNPQSEIYYESLRYLSGLTATSQYTWSGNEDDHYIAGLKHASWKAPVTNTNYCAPLSILQFNSSTNSYDSGSDSDYPGISGIGLADTAAMDKKTDEVGTFEGITNTLRFVGKIIGGSGTDVDQLCTAKNITALSKVSGTCPDSPRLEGGYGMVGLARFARDVGLKINGVTKWVEKNRYGVYTNPVRTYAVALAPSVPKVEVPVPGTTTGQKIIIQPACRNISNNPATNCAIVDFKVVDQQSNALTSNADFPETSTTSTNYGILYVSWEDSEQGGDYDQDMWGVIKYAITGSRVYIKTQVLAQSSTQPLGFGYILTGTKDIITGNTSDGFHVHSGILNFTDGKECLNTDNHRCTCRLGTGSDTAFNICAGVSAQQKIDTGASKRVYAVSTATTASFLPSPLYYAAKWGGYDSKFQEQNLANLDTAIANRNPSDSFFYATDPSALEIQLKTAFESISKDIRSAGGVATNNPRLSNDAFLFQTKFNTSDWSGELLALKFDSNGLLVRNSNGDPIVQASTKDSGRMPTNEVGRTVYTNYLTPSPISATSSYPVAVDTLSWSKFNSSQKKALQLSSESTDAQAQKRVDWLLGNAKDEQSDSNSSGVLRSRSTAAGVRNILGDLVNSSPVYVGADDYNFSRLPAKVSGGQTYDQFVKTKSSGTDPSKITPLIFVGSNDGMLHAFNATYKDSSGNIQISSMFKEVYAYIPQIVFSLPANSVGTDTKLAKLSGTDYGRSANPHRYIVDGPIVTSDVWIPDDPNSVVGTNSTGKWKTIIVGTLGAGGRGIYALDVTNRLKPTVLFEFTDMTCKVAVADNSTCADANKYYPSLGYVLGAPVIAQLPNGRFVVIFGNGDTAGTTTPPTSSLFIIDIAAPFNSAFSKVISTGAGTGLSAVEVLPNSIGQGVSAYAGDLSGNLWHFNLSSTNPSDWAKDYLLFQAKDGNGNAQPIFAAPTLGYNLKSNKLMVYFGTGKYYDTGDNVANATPIHSLYAIADVGSVGSPVARSTLKQKGIINGTSSTTPSFSTRTEDSSKQPTWTGATPNNGWYLDLPSTGERITTTPVLIDDKVIFPTLVPSPDACVAGGNNWIMEMTATGALTYKNKTVLDPTSNKYRSGLILGNLATGRKSDGNGSALGATTEGAIIEEKMSLEPGTIGRQSWRQLR